MEYRMARNGLRISKETKDRISSWLADSEDPSLIRESWRKETFVTDEEIEVILKEESFSLLAEINEFLMAEEEQEEEETKDEWADRMGRIMGDYAKKNTKEEQ